MFWSKSVAELEMIGRAEHMHLIVDAERQSMGISPHGTVWE